MGQTVCKPGSVHTPKGGGDHSSGMPVTRHLMQPTRATIRKQIMRCSYLVLLPTGFTLPLPLPAVRCALTAPFHPYRLRGGLLSVALSLESPPPDVIRRRVSVEPGLSSLANKSDHPTIWPICELRRHPQGVKPDVSSWPNVKAHKLNSGFAHRPRRQCFVVGNGVEKRSRQPAFAAHKRHLAPPHNHRLPRFFARQQRLALRR